MTDLSSPSTEFALSAEPWHASGAHPVLPPSGSYILVDHSALLSAATPGVISPVLVLPSAEDAEQIRLRADALAGRG